MQGVSSRTQGLLNQLAARWDCSVDEVVQRFADLEECGEAHAVSLRLQADLASFQVQQFRLGLAGLLGGAIEESEAAVMQHLHQSRWLAALTGDLWRWQAHYSAGSTLVQVDEAGQEHGWADVEQARLVAVSLLPQHPTLPAHVLKLAPGQRAVFFRRKGAIYDPDTGFQMPQPAVTVLGWETEEAALYTFYHWDGSTVISADRQAVQAG